MVLWGGCTSKSTPPLPPQRVTQALGGSATPPSADGVWSWGVGYPSPTSVDMSRCLGRARALRDAVAAKRALVHLELGQRLLHRLHNDDRQSGS